MKLNPQRLVFGDFEFCQLVEQAVKDYVLAYSQTKFVVKDVTFDAENDEW